MFGPLFCLDVQSIASTTPEEARHPLALPDGKTTGEAEPIFGYVS